MCAHLKHPLPTNDAPVRHDLCELSISLWGGFNTRRYTPVHGFCFFKLFLMVGKGLIGHPHNASHLDKTLLSGYFNNMYGKLQNYTSPSALRER